MQSALHAHGPQKPQNGGPESGTKTDVVSRGASVKNNSVMQALADL